jgi:L-fucose isomerase-like protein
MKDMKLNLITFGSSLSSRESIFEYHKELLDRLKAAYDVTFVYPEELGNGLPEGTTMVFVGSGGVEEMVAAAIDKLPDYVLLVADGLKNSLAASLEILSWMRLEGRRGRVLHGNVDYIMKGVADYVAGREAVEWLRGRRVGVIGKPSGWLIASGVDYASVRTTWGVELVDLPLDEVISGYEAVADDAVQHEVDTFVNGAVGMKEPSRADVVKAMRLYVAIKAMCAKHALDALTLNCFDLIPPTRTTGCLALALLNGEGIPAGCEGDIQTILTMLAVKAAIGEPCFMANPSKMIDNEKHEMVLAHCTIAPCLTDRYVVRSHYESLSGVAIEGILNAGQMAVVKCGGRRMERYFVSEATLLECTENPNMCRTQLHLRLKEPLDYFLERSIGNHHVIVKGDCRSRMELIFEMLGAAHV